MKKVDERTDIDKEVKITLLSVLQKGYFEQKDIDLLKSKVKPLENQSTIVYFRDYSKEKGKECTENKEIEQDTE